MTPSLSPEQRVHLKRAAREKIFQAARDVSVMAPMDDEAQDAAHELRGLAWKLDHEINQLEKQQ